MKPKKNEDPVKAEFKRNIRERVTDTNYRRMLIYMYDESNIDETVINNVIECINNPNKYKKEVIKKLENLKNYFTTARISTTKQKQDLSKILKNGTSLFNDLDSLRKRYIKLPSYYSKRTKNKDDDNNDETNDYNSVEDEDDVVTSSHDVNVAIDNDNDNKVNIEEEEEELEQQDHYYRNRYNKDSKFLKDNNILSKEYIDTLLCFYRIADDHKKYPLFNEEDSEHIKLTVKLLTEEIDSYIKKKGINVKTELNKIQTIIATSIQVYENKRRKTNKKTIQTIAENYEIDGEQLMKLYRQSSTIDANQLKKFGLLNDEFSAEDLYNYYNKAINPEDETDIRIRKYVLELHNAIRETNIFDEETEPKNKEQIKKLIHYLKENGDREIFYNMNSDLENETLFDNKMADSDSAPKETIGHSINDEDFDFGFDDESEDDIIDNLNKSITKYKAPRKSKKPEEKEVEFDQQVSKLFKPYNVLNNENTYMPDKDYIKDLMKKEESSVIRGKRSDRDIDDLPDKLKTFKVENLVNETEGNISFYNNHLLDIIINGNYRIKYIPNAAARDTAQEYAHNHVDENGVPRYRLLPPNAKDPIGNPITDLNGDRVEDVVLVDKRGIPRIINGYKLVRASPYKKVWLSTVNKAKRKEKPFNTWLAEQFNKDINDVNWRKGEYNINANEDMKEYRKHYSSLGLGKPRISKRLSPQSYWSSVFSYIWKFFWIIEYPQYKIVTKLLNYLSISNAMYVILIDIGAKRDLEKSSKYKGKILNYPAWLNYKREHKADYNERVGPKIVKLREAYIDDIVDTKTGEILVEQLEKNNLQHKGFANILSRLFILIFKQIFCLENPNDENIQELIQEQIINSTPEDIKYNKDFYKKQVTKIINKLYGDNSKYLEYKNKYDEQKIERKAQAFKYDINKIEDEY